MAGWSTRDSRVRLPRLAGAMGLAPALHLAAAAARPIGGRCGDPLRDPRAAAPRLGGPLDLLVLPVALRTAETALGHGSPLAPSRARSGSQPTHVPSRA